MKAQSAVLDGLFFVLVCGAAATLLFYTSGLYGASTSRQVSTVYNYEYAGTALVSLHYARDTEGKWFWIELKDHLSSTDPTNKPSAKVKNYLGVGGNARDVWNSVLNSSPSRKPVLYFIGWEKFYCYGEPIKCGSSLPDEYQNATVFSSSVKTIDKMNREWEVVLQLYY